MSVGSHPPGVLVLNILSGHCTFDQERAFSQSFVELIKVQPIVYPQYHPY
jgi:hypothetical protein